MKVRGSAEGAEYDSQGQARSASPLVTMNKLKRALKVRNININYSALSALHGHCGVLPGATRLTLFGACPWLSYAAPSALNSNFCAKLRFDFAEFGYELFQVDLTQITNQKTGRIGPWSSRQQGLFDDVQQRPNETFAESFNTGTAV